MRQFKFRLTQQGAAIVLVGDREIGTVHRRSDGWHGFGVEGVEAPRVRNTRNEAGIEVYAMYMKSEGRKNEAG